MKKITSLLLIFALTVVCVFAFASCGDHSHSFGEEWKSDANNHWHEATCEHTNAQGDLAAHTYGSDYKCTVCGYTHTHSYEAIWSFDENQHWKAASCGHADEKSEVAVHDYASDGTCTTCGYYPDVAAGAHKHTFNNNWTSDGTGHWHSSKCGHDVRADFAAHQYNVFGSAYICMFCSYVHTHSYEAAWSADSTGHWHATLCGHDESITDSAKTAHTYVDGTCSTCGYYNPDEHTVSENWSVDENGHWYACECHGYKFDHAIHTYDESFKCTVCEYQHRHVVDTEVFDYDFGGHWNVTSCGHEHKSNEGAHEFENGVCTVCGYDINTLSSDELAAIAVIYSHSVPTKVVTTSKQKFAEIELEGENTLVVTNIRGKVVARYTVKQEEIRSLEAGGKDEFIREEILLNHTITEYYEDLGLRTVNPNTGEASAWDPEGESFVPANGGIALDLRLGYVTDLSYEDGVLTCVVPAAYTVYVFGAYAGADVELTIATAGGYIESVSLHYVVPADEANYLEETVVDITATYEYDEQTINID